MELRSYKDKIKSKENVRLRWRQNFCLCWAKINSRDSNRAQCYQIKLISINSNWNWINSLEIDDIIPMGALK
jgi:hypothetical protein